ncbi:MAG: L-threonylcarbamoyladenylate synthase [bacterium]|nr:L-threonylcarbamoyladenylate synthase [bacterium]
MPARILAPDEAAYAEAAQILRAGGLVAFPTETVYGLGANALDARAVARIFEAKGRPSDNPIIVHVADAQAARELASRWPPAAEPLAEAGWPGPLTLVVEKADVIPDIVTAGGPTVGLRVPDHPVANALLRASALPIAAPSANRSEAVSPTTARHVADSLGPFVDDLLILDGGPCAVGIESTVVDVTDETPVTLRPGMFRLEEEEAGLEAEAPGTRSGGPARSPGQKPRHYAPSKPLVLVDEGTAERAQRLGDALLVLGDDPENAAARLYAELHRLSADPDVARILVEHPPQDAAWAGIRDRLRRAASD